MRRSSDTLAILLALAGLLGFTPRVAQADPDWYVLDASSHTAGAGALYEVEAPTTPSAEIASGFDADAESWTMTDNVPNALDYQASGGNPGGFIWDEDTEAGPLFHFVAPAGYTGDQSAKIGGTFSWDWKALVKDNENAGAGGAALRIEGGSIVVEAYTGQTHVASWESESVPLVHKHFHCVSGCSGSPSAGEFLTVMSSVVEIALRGDWYRTGAFGAPDTVNPDDATGIDNVRMTAPPTGPAPAAVSSGNLLVDPAGVAVEADGQVVVTDRNAAAGPSLIRIDPDTGTQSTISSGGSLTGPLGVAVEDDGNLLVADAAGAVIRVDPVSGTQSTLTSGGNLEIAMDLAVEASGDILVLSRSPFAAGGAVVRVHPATGVQTLLSSGGSFSAPMGIALEASGDAVIADANAFDRKGGVLRIDAVSGAQTTVASGRFFDDPRGILVASDGTLVVVDPQAGDQVTAKGSVILVDPGTGAQSLAVTGAPFRDPVAIAPLPLPACSDGVDNDGDGEVDFGPSCTAIGGPDCGCASAEDDSEKDETGFYLCDDDVDNDADGLVDYPADSGCRKPGSVLENPACNDGMHNDFDGLIDFDGGAEASQAGAGCIGFEDPYQCCTGAGTGCSGAPDPECSDSWQNKEKGGCGLGLELALLLPGLLALGRRRA